MEFHINYLAVVVAAAARFIVGAIWFSPPLFLKPWREMTGVSEEKMRAGMARALISDAIGCLVMAFVLLYAIHFAAAAPGAQVGNPIVFGAVAGFFNWLGFISVPIFSLAVHEHRSLRYYLVTSGYNLVALLIMGAILAAWT
jgi:phosphate starvation-inducible membrane PsiE